MFEVPGSKVKAVHIEEDTVRGKESPRYEYHEEEEEGEGSTSDDRQDGGEEEVRSQEGGRSEDVAVAQSSAAKANV